MKYFAVFLLLAIFISPNVAFATQGACSWHGGINCVAGADWDESVICNDGWRESSVLYSNSAICTESCAWGYTDKFKQVLVDCLNTDSAHTIELKEELVYWQTLERQWVAERNALYSDSMTAEQEAQIIGLNSQVQGAHRRVREIEGYISNWEATDIRACQALANTFGANNCKEPQIIMNDCPRNATYNGSLCECGVGYIWNSVRTECVLNRPVQTPIRLVQAIEVVDPQISERIKAGVMGMEQQFIDGDSIVEKDNEVPTTQIEETKNGDGLFQHALLQVKNFFLRWFSFRKHGG